jgi:kinetochore protein Mis13/DSN1
MPHESVSSDKLYRHIDTELPEPHRARHLLIWCARRAAVPVQQDPKGKGKAKAKGNGLNDADSALVASVQDRIVRQLMDLTIDIPLYDISGGPFAADLGKGKKGKEVLAEDPVNMRNREVKEKLAKAEERCVCLHLYQFCCTDIRGDMTARETKTPCGQK